MSEFADYVLACAVRGACTCGKCIDSSGNPEEKQPEGHTVDLTFFKVAKTDGTDAEVFKTLVEKHYPHWLDGKEHNYLECGGDVGDQGIALMAFGLGHLLGIWKVLSPETMMPFLPPDLKQQMAGSGMISINSQPEKAKQEVAKVLKA